MDNALLSRIHAFDHTTGEQLLWTPELVGLRMIEAFDALSRTHMTSRPKQFGSAWPAMQKEWEDLLDPKAWQNAQERRERVSSDQMSRAEESLLWPMAHLSGLLLHCDALHVWAHGRATGRNIAGLLRRRTLEAEALAKAMTERENAKRLLIRQQVALDVTAWANQRLVEANGDVQRCKNIKFNADIRARREIDARDAWNIAITPAQATPDKVRKETTLERYRKAACQIIAENLQKSGVVVRHPSQDY